MNNKVLIVDDEENLLELVRVNLIARGLEVFIAQTGEEGLKLAEEIRPAIVILDVFLPGISGWDVCRQLKSESVTHNAKIIFLTAATQKEDVEEAKKVGGDFFLPKPFDIEELTDIVIKMLRR